MSNEEIDYTNAEMLRRKAEEKLTENQKKSDKLNTESDVKKLVHELQVHQIELEMQNEELRQAYETAEAALKKYTMLFDLAPVGYFSLNAEGTINELNFTGADILKERRFSLIGSNFKLFVSEASRPVFNNFFRKVFTGNSKETCEVLLGHEKEPLCYVYMEGVVAEVEQLCLLSVIDISKFSLLNKE
jgi:PAS domain-containing protein